MDEYQDGADNEADPQDATDDLLKEAREAFECASQAETDNRLRAKADLEFARMHCQWDPVVAKQRREQGRPCLTYNTLPTYIRQVVNDSRQNKPSIQVQPVDSGADPETAEIFSGLIRNIEVSSDADVAYDTAIEGAASNGFGYIRINTAYTSEDSFDQDIVIERISNPFSVFGDPHSEKADSSDWDTAFVVTTITKDEFERKYRGAEAVDFDAQGYTGLASPWFDDDQVMVAEYWKRETVESEIVALSNGVVVDLQLYLQHPENYADLSVVGSPRVVQSKRVMQYIITGAEVLEANEWPGKYIPIVPVYGEEVNLEGKRHLYSLIHAAIDAQRDYNYWRTTTTELIALAPKAPFIGEEGAFDADPNWSTANSETHAYLEYAKGTNPPQRQPFAGPPAGAIQLAMQARDDIKAAIGLYDASLGARSNETSGVAINARAREGDVSTFHFVDNLTRAIRHCGRILVDLIPKVYTSERVLRVMGHDMKPQTVQVSQDAEAQNAANQAKAHMQAMQAVQGAQDPQAAYQAEVQARMSAISRIYDISAGKYDVTVKTGPSYTTQREAARAEIVQIIQAVPQSSTVLGPMYLRNSDWPGADEAADKIEAMQGGGNGAQGQVAAMQAQLAQLQAQLAQAEADSNNKAAENQIKAQDAQTKQFQAETDRMRALNEANPIPPAMPMAQPASFGMPGAQPAATPQFAATA